ncbi:MAG: 4Fe-4S dicluster domain-containing protein [Bacteroidales bacterium]|nr:4Fe-4S dicluster domain-containing protein [Bacteroidales bacterium]
MGKTTVKKQFGFSVNNDRQIDYDAIDHSLYRLVEEKEPSIHLCISCGTCSATCTAANFTDFSLRKSILLLKRGLYTGLFNEVSKCMLCGKCQLACPKGVNTRNLVLQMAKALQPLQK